MGAESDWWAQVDAGAEAGVSKHRQQRAASWHGCWRCRLLPGRPTNRIISQPRPITLLIATLAVSLLPLPAHCPPCPSWCPCGRWSGGSVGHLAPQLYFGQLLRHSLFTLLAGQLLAQDGPALGELRSRLTTCWRCRVVWPPVLPRPPRLPLHASSRFALPAHGPSHSLPMEVEIARDAAGLRGWCPMLKEE